MRRSSGYTNRGRPVLVGTISIEKSERLSAMLSRRGIKHQVLNAKYHEKEAEIIAQAGRLGAVTIATNMAGRGTDILLGGNPSFWRGSFCGKRVFHRRLRCRPFRASRRTIRKCLLHEMYQEFLKQCKEETDGEKEQVISWGPSCHRF